MTRRRITMDGSRVINLPATWQAFILGAALSMVATALVIDMFSWRVIR